MNAQISIILLILLRSPKSYHKTKAIVNTLRCSGMLTNIVIVVGGQDLFDLCENEQVFVYEGTSAKIVCGLL